MNEPRCKRQRRHPEQHEQSADKNSSHVFAPEKTLKSSILDRATFVEFPPLAEVRNVRSWQGPLRSAFGQGANFAIRPVADLAKTDQGDAVNLLHSLSGLFLISLPLTGCGPPLGWEKAQALPIAFQDGLEIGRNDPTRRAASLNLVCDTGGSLRIMLHTRLPIPSYWRREVHVGGGKVVVARDDDVAIFIGGIEHKIPIAFDWIVGRQLDEAVSDPLSHDDLVKLADWYGLKAPARVSVMGISETGTFLHGKGSAADITAFRNACRPSQN